MSINSILVPCVTRQQPCNPSMSPLKMNSPLGRHGPFLVLRSLDDNSSKGTERSGVNDDSGQSFGLSALF